MANTNHSINSQYKLISNLISTKSDRDFNILINNIAGNIKSLILSASKKVSFTVDVDEAYSKTLSILWDKLPSFHLSANKLEGVNSFFSYIKNIAFNCVRGQRGALIRESKRSLYIDSFKDNHFEVEDERPSYFAEEDEIEFWRNQVPEKQRDDFDVLVDFAYNEYSVEAICAKHCISSSNDVYVKNNKVRKILRNLRHSIN